MQLVGLYYVVEIQYVNTKMKRLVLVLQYMKHLYLKCSRGSMLIVAQQANKFFALKFTM